MVCFVLWRKHLYFSKSQWGKGFAVGWNVPLKLSWHVFYYISLCFVFFLSGTASSKKDPFLQQTASHFGRALGTAITPHLLALFHHLIAQFINLMANPTISAWTVPPLLYRVGLSKATLLWPRSCWSVPTATNNAVTALPLSVPVPHLEVSVVLPKGWCLQGISKGQQCGEQRETALLQGCTRSGAHSELNSSDCHTPRKRQWKLQMFLSLRASSPGLRCPGTSACSKAASIQHRGKSKHGAATKAAHTAHWSMSDIAQVGCPHFCMKREASAGEIICKKRGCIKNTARSGHPA